MVIGLINLRLGGGQWGKLKVNLWLPRLARNVNKVWEFWF